MKLFLILNILNVKHLRDECLPEFIERTFNPETQFLEIVFWELMHIFGPMLCHSKQETPFVRNEICFMGPDRPTLG
jgi:hypothetical protein